MEKLNKQYTTIKPMPPPASNYLHYKTYCKMEFFSLSLLVGADIILGIIYRYLDSLKPKPLTFLEFFNFMYDQKQDIIKILENENLETRKQLFNNYLNTRDLINKKDGKN